MVPIVYHIFQIRLKIKRWGNGNSNMCFSEKRLTALMKKTSTEELEKQQQSLLKLISPNFEIPIKEIKKY